MPSTGWQSRWQTGHYTEQPSGDAAPAPETPQPGRGSGQGSCQFVVGGDDINSDLELIRAQSCLFLTFLNDHADRGDDEFADQRVD